jgi:hypothetical protein
LKQPKVGVNLLWFKRILPIALILIGWFGYQWYNEYQLSKIIEAEEKYAEVTALIWVASAKYRNDQTIFVEYRDSVLTEFNITAEDISSYIDKYESNPEFLGPLANLISEKVDSLVALEDSSILDDSLIEMIEDEL